MALKIWGSRMTAEFFNRDSWVNFELTAVLLSAAGKFVVGDVFGQKIWFAIAAGILWLSYIAARIRSRPELVEIWGLSSVNIGRSLKLVLPVTAAACAAAILYGLSSEIASIDWHMALLFLLYPLWGTVQQFLLVVLVAGNIDRLSRGRFPRLFIILPTAVLFSLVHYPEATLMIITFFMGCFTTAVFLKYRSIWAIGLFHGLFATVLYYFVLGEDPLRIFLQFLG